MQKQRVNRTMNNYNTGSKSAQVSFFISFNGDGAAIATNVYSYILAGCCLI